MLKIKSILSISALGLCSFVAVLQTSNIAPTFTPLLTPYPLADLDLQILVEDPSGAPWTSDLLLVINSDHSGFRLEEKITPNSTGLVSGTFPIDSSAALAGHPYQIELWLDNEMARAPAKNQFFVNPSSGAAAFLPSTQLTWDSTAGRYTLSQSAVISEPTLYGTIQINNPAAFDLYLGVQDFTDVDSRTWKQRVLGQTNTIDIGVASSVALYRWSRSGATQVGLATPALGVLCEALLRRNGSASAAVPQMKSISVEVDLSVHADAFEILIVEASQHVASPSDPHFFYAVQSVNAPVVRRRNMNLSTFVTTASLPLPDSHVVELWGKSQPSSGPPNFSLLDSSAIPSGASNVAVQFN